VPTPAPTPGVSTPEEIEAWMSQQLPSGAPLPPASQAYQPWWADHPSKPVPGWLLLGSAALLGWWFLRK